MKVGDFVMNSQPDVLCEKNNTRIHCRDFYVFNYQERENRFTRF